MVEKGRAMSKDLGRSGPLLNHPIGIDVYSELQSRGVSPANRSQNPSPASPNAPIMHQAIMNRHQQAQRHPPALPTKLEPDYSAPPIQSLRISPTSATSTNTPCSSRYSSPVSGYGFPPMMEQRNTPQISQSQSRHGSQSQQLYAANYNYGGFPAMVQGQMQHGGSEQQTGSLDVSKFGYAGFQGYNTPSSMDDSQPSRHSSMAQTTIGSLGKLNPAFFGSYI